MPLSDGASGGGGVEADVMLFKRFIDGIAAHALWRVHRTFRTQRGTGVFIRLCEAAGFKHEGNKCRDTSARGDAKLAKAAQRVMNRFVKVATLAKADIVDSKKVPFALGDRPLAPKTFNLTMCVFDRDAVCAKAGSEAEKKKGGFQRLQGQPRFYGCVLMIREG